MKNKIKKALSLILLLVMVLSLFGCGKEDNIIDETDGTSENNEIVGTNQEANSSYAEDQVLFYAQNKYHLEEDSHIIHFYNYKGELLSSNDTSRMNSFYIPSYHKSGLTPAIDFITGKCGVVNEKGEFVVEPKYENMYPFSKDGLALVTCETEEWNVNVYGYINTKGEEVIPCNYDFATSFYDNGLAIVGVALEDFDANNNGVNYKYGVIDKNGEYVLKPEFYNINDIKGEYILCLTEDWEYVIYNLSGDVIFKYAPTNDEYNEYFNCRGENIFIHRYNDDESVNEYLIFNGEEFVEYDKNIIDKDTKIITAEESGRGYGVYYKGETVIPCEYEDIYVVNNYYIAINSHRVKSFDIYNSNFEKTAEKLEYEYEEFRCSDTTLPNGYFDVIKNENGITLYGIIDYTGKIIIEPVFSEPIMLNTYESLGNFGLDINYFLA